MTPDRQRLADDLSHIVQAIDRIERDAEGVRLPRAPGP